MANQAPQYDYDMHQGSMGSGELSQLTALADRLELAEDEIAKVEAQLKELKRARDHLAINVIPEAFEKCGLDPDDGSLPLGKSKRKLVVKQHVTAGIPKGKEGPALSWLREHGQGELIKNLVVVEFGKGGDNVAKALLDDLRKQGLQAGQTEGVHPQTLAAFARRQLSAGKDLPMELLGVNRFRKAQVVD